jgi:hypothetical protein
MRAERNRELSERSANLKLESRARAQDKSVRPE